MPNHIYKARDAAGKMVEGTMDAESKEALIDKLYKMGYMVTQVKEVSAGFKIEAFFSRFRTISAEDMVMFNVQLSNMINAGIGILMSLDLLNNQAENPRLRETLGSVKRSVEAGDSLSEALARHPNIFSGLFVNMVKAGEASGKLDNILMKYAEYYEHQADLRQKVKGALFYPAILLCAGLIVTLFIVTFIIPQFVEIFAKSGIRLPLPTLILYNVGTGIKKFWYIAAAAAALLWLGVRYYGKTARGRLTFDNFRLNSPVIGPIHRKAAISKFARTFATLASSGVPVLQSLDIVKDVMENEVLSRAVINVRNAVERGEKIAEPMRISGEFPPDAVQMISVGEETGNLDGMLNKISDFYDMSLGYAIKRMTTIIEPLLLVIMGALVGFIMASMLLPIFDMIKTLRQ